MAEQAKQWLGVFDDLLRITRDKAPVRRGARSGPDPYRLQRSPNEKIDRRSRERLLEQMLWKQWGPGVGTREFIPGVCGSVVTYQMPLKDKHADSGWGKVDFVGMTPGDGLPVIGELKREARPSGRGSSETPLRMIAEALAYGLALQRAWEEGDLRSEWAAKVLDCPPEQLPPTLQRLTLLCTAPAEYWATRIGDPQRHTNGRVPPSGWDGLHHVVAACGRSGFDVHFVTFDVDEPGDGTLFIKDPRQRTLPLDGAWPQS